VTLSKSSRDLGLIPLGLGTGFKTVDEAVRPGDSDGGQPHHVLNNPSFSRRADPAGAAVGRRVWDVAAYSALSRYPTFCSGHFLTALREHRSRGRVVA